MQAVEGGTLDTDYQTSIANRTRATGTSAFRFGAESVSYGDSDLSVSSITSYDQGSVAGGYTVRGGETLASIAADLWGDASLWYKLAEANGLTAQSALSEGQRLSIPAGVMKSTHNASTFKPYDPAETIGDTSPTTRKPPKKSKNCGMFGQILLVVVAVAVTTITGSPIAGNLASQAVGLATGIQDKFSWKSLAITAVTAGVTAGIDASGVFSGIQSLALQNAVTAATANGITQGISIATGLQNKFDWAGVAAAGVAAGTATAVGNAAGAQPLKINNSLSNHAAHALAGTAAAVAGAATRSLINGSSFGDNLIRVLPDVIVSTIGNAISYGVSRPAGAGGGAADINYDAIMRGAPKLSFDGSAGSAMAAPGTTSAATVDPAAGAGGGRVSIGGGSAGSSAAAATTTGGSVEDDIEEIVITARKRDGGDGHYGKAHGGIHHGQTVFIMPPGGKPTIAVDAQGYPGTYSLRSDGNVQFNRIDIAKVTADIKQFERESTDILTLGPKLGVSMASAGADFVLTGIAYVQGDVPLSDMATSALPGAELFGLARRMDRSSRLLPNEGRVGTFDELRRAGSRGDNITPHHIPSANHMAQHGVSKGEGVAINMEHPVPGIGGRHRQTFTYGTKADASMSPRDALASGVWDARRIYRQEGLYDPYVRGQLQQVIRENKVRHPDLFRKPR